MTNRHRYPLQPLADAMGLSLNQACLRLGISGSTQIEYRTRGITEKVADRLAIKADLHPYQIWPDMLDHQIEAHEQAAKAIKNAGERRRYRTNTAKRLRRLKTRRAYYEEHGEYERAQQRTRSAAHYRQNRQAISERRKATRAANLEEARAKGQARSAAYYAANREQINARARARRHAAKNGATTTPVPTTAREDHVTA